MTPIKLTKELCGQSNPKRLPPHFLRNATTIHYKTAQEAGDLSKQNFTVTPRCWYIDAEFPCQDCNKTFLFSANEQRFWYEDLRFYVDSLPIRCPNCRKA